jgi:hypothetical protein
MLKFDELIPRARSGPSQRGFACPELGRRNPSPAVIPDFLAQSALSDSDRQALGRIHPAFMGGEYLPDLAQSEVMIARITIASTTQDVTGESRGSRFGWSNTGSSVNGLSAPLRLACCGSALGWQRMAGREPVLFPS